MTSLEKGKSRSLALSIALDIESKEKCALVQYCNKKLSISCSGERIPNCILEQKLTEDTLTTKEREELKQVPLLKHLGKLQNIVQQSYRGIKPVFESSVSNFTCPYLKSMPLPCNLALCVYNTPKIDKTNCIISYAQNKEDWLDIDKFSVLKVIDREIFINLVFTHALNKWDIIEKFLGRWDKDIHFCRKCGYLLSQCRRYPEACEKRKEVYNTIHWDIPLSISNTYPMLLIISSFRRIFGDYAVMLIPKQLLNSYGPVK